MFTECGERATSVTRQPPFWMTNALKAQPHVVNTVFTHVFGSQAGHGLLLSRRRATEVCESASGKRAQESRVFGAPAAS